MGKNISSSYKEEGLKGIMKNLIRRAVHAGGYDDEFNTLFYFLNKYADISKVPKAEGALRDLQLCDYELMRIFNAVCKKHNLQYWIAYGTLLGAVRHKGFIPWDDDTDIAMPRSDYEKILAILNQELSKYGIEAEEQLPMWRIGLSYKHYETGIWIDIFPVDSVGMPNEVEICAEELEKRILKYRKYYHRHIKHTSVDKIQSIKHKIIPDSGDYRICYHNPEFVYRVTVMHDEDDIFPLGTMKFEDGVTQLNVPNNPDSYLRRIYGNNYMSFPRWGVEHHGTNESTLSDWASVSKTDMKKVRCYLKNIAATLEQEITNV